MSMREEVRAAAGLDDAQLQHAYDEAITRGVRNTGCGSEQERAYGTLRLLTLALLRLPDLALYAHFAHVCDEHLDEVTDDGHEELLLLGHTVCEVAAGALRLCHRALETHGRDVGYEVGGCLEQARARAREQLRDPGGVLEMPVAIEQARNATIALTRATAASADNPLQFCERLSQTLGHLLALYAVTREAER
jgi:hypothetical protein